MNTKIKKTPIAAIERPNKQIEIYKVYVNCYFLVDNDSIVGTDFNLFGNPDEEVIKMLNNNLFNGTYQIVKIPLVYVPQEAYSYVIGN